MTQYQANLLYWTAKRDKAASFALWLIAQQQVDRLFVALGCGQANGLAALADEELIFPQIMAGFENTGSKIRQ